MAPDGCAGLGLAGEVGDTRFVWQLQRAYRCKQSRGVLCRSAVALGRDVLERLGQENQEPDPADWLKLLDEFIDQVVANSQLFLLHERNHNAFEELEHSEHHKAEHEDLGAQLRRFLAKPSIPLALRVRMACSIGAVFGALVGAGEAFGDVAVSEVAELVREAVHGLMDPTVTPARGAVIPDPIPDTPQGAGVQA
jgi:hypothetical protein